MITSYQSGSIDMAIGLTEGWINGLSIPANTSLYRLVGTYVSSPLTWAISAGINAPIQSSDELKGRKIGVSRIGSGSYVMGYVFADQRGWLTDSAVPFEFVKLDTFKGLRDGVNDGTVSAFMWEKFTTKKYFDAQEVKQIGSIATPWPSWVITSSSKVSDDQQQGVLRAINEGIKYFWDNHDESMQLIHQELGYSLVDAEAWSKTVEYPSNVVGVDVKMVDETIRVLRKAGLMKEAPKLQGPDIV